MNLKEQQIDALPFRCHSVGDLMGVKGLGETGKKRAIYTHIELTTGRTKKISSKFLEKGTYNELEAMQIANKVLGLDLVKNNDREFNDYLTGECDSKDQTKVADIKCSWDLYTFREAKIKLNTDYEWQGRGYMELYDKNEFWLIYVLTDTPTWIIENELKKLMNEYGDIENVGLAYQVITNHIYSKETFISFVESQNCFTRNKSIEDNFIEIPESERVFCYKITRDESKTKLMYSRIIEAREFLKTKLL